MPGEYGPTGLGRFAACTGRCDGWDMRLLCSGARVRRAAPDILARVPRFKLTIEYAGTRYSGWQKQRNARTVQGELDRAIVEAIGDGAGRLAGLGPHRRRRARAGARWRTSTSPAPRRRSCSAAASTTPCPADIHVLDVAPVSRTFHARHSAVRRSYVYQISRRRTAFAKPYVWWVKDPLDLARDAGGWPRRSSACTTSAAFSDDDPGEKSTLVRARRGDRGRSRRAPARARGRIALPVEDGAAHGRRAGGRAAPATSPAGDVVVARWPDEPAATPARLTAPAAGLFLERVLLRGRRLAASRCGRPWRCADGRRRSRAARSRRRSRAHARRRSTRARGRPPRASSTATRRA